MNHPISGLVVIFLTNFFGVHVAEAKKSSALMELPIGNTLELLIPCPVSKGWETKKPVLRECSVRVESGRAKLGIAKLPDHISKSEFATLEGPFVISFDWLPEIKNEADLLAFMKRQRVANEPRYLLNEIEHKLAKIRRRVSIGAVYDLSLENFDPREPSSPDVFVLTSKPKGAICLKDAWHLQFDWSQASLRTR